MSEMEIFNSEGERVSITAEGCKEVMLLRDRVAELEDVELLRELVNALQGELVDVLHENVKLQADNKRLREALESIVAREDSLGLADVLSGKIARAALKEINIDEE